MNCRNCGAPMQLFARRRYYFCGFCGTFEFIATPAVDGVQVLERSPAARQCPLCTAALARALLDEAYAIEHCERCRGLLIERAHFSEAIERRRASAAGPGAPPAPLDPRELERTLSCPSCAHRMDVHPYY